MKNHPMRSASLMAIALLGPACAVAADDHRPVEEATLLQRGECEQESWVRRFRGGSEAQLAIGLACRVGPVQLGATRERAREEDGHATSGQLEAKWGREVAEDLFLALGLQPEWEWRRGVRYSGTQVAVLGTWSPRLDLDLHVNLGRDFVHRGRDLPYHGMAIEWTPTPGWWVLAERYFRERTHFVGVGVRWEAGRQWSIDLTHARRLAGPGLSHWTLGVTIDLDDD